VGTIRLLEIVSRNSHAEDKSTFLIFVELATKALFIDITRRSEGLMTLGILLTALKRLPSTIFSEM
jgi:hypothetical protein